MSLVMRALLSASELEPRRQLLRHGDVFEPHVTRQAILEWRKILATHERRQIAPRLGCDAEAVAGDIIAGHFLLDVGYTVERRHADLPAIRLVGDAHDRGHHRTFAGERQFDRRLAD